MIEASFHLDRGGFSLDVAITAESPVTGLFGPSGAGKTTLIDVLAGLARPDGGSISLNGRTLYDHARSIDVPAHRRRIGVVFQEHRLFPHYSVEGNLRYGRRKGGDDLAHIAELLELGPLLSRRPRELSGGERQRVALGRALLSAPDLLLLDEPLASLDERLKQQIIPYLGRVRDVLGVPMVYVSHDLGEILQLTESLLVLERGRVVGRGRYIDLVHDDAVLAVVHDRGMSNLVAARVRSNVPAEGVSILEIGAANEAGRQSCELVAPLAPAAPGERVTLSIRPWDIALSTAPLREVSIQNQIRGTVRRSTIHERSALVEVDVGAPLIVEISRRSAVSLGIEIGRAIVCLIKSNAIRYTGAP